MRIIFFVQPKAVATINRNYKELTVSFLLYFHRMKRIHLIYEAILCFRTLGLNVNELLFDLSRHCILRTEGTIGQKRGLWRPLVTDLNLNSVGKVVVFDYFSEIIRIGTSNFLPNLIFWNKWAMRFIVPNPKAICLHKFDKQLRNVFHILIN